MSTSIPLPRPVRLVARSLLHLAVWKERIRQRVRKIRAAIQRVPVRRTTEHQEFLRDARFLLLAGYHHPAGMTARCALESCLRVTLMRHGRKLPPSRTVHALTSQLYEAGVIDSQLWDRLQSIMYKLNACAHARRTKPKTVRWMVNETCWICNALDNIERRNEAA